MTPATIALLIASLFMLGSGGTPPGTVQLLLSGPVTLAIPHAAQGPDADATSATSPTDATSATSPTDATSAPSPTDATSATATATAGSSPGAIIVGDAQAHLPAGAELTGPIHVIGGELTVDGHVTGDVVQLAGTVVVGEGARIDGELRHVAGTLEVDPGAEIARRSTVDLTSDGGGGPRSYVLLVVTALLLALVGGRLARTRPRALGNVADAVTHHPVIVLTVGSLLALTAIAAIVFMGFTLVLIPVALVALAVGAVVLAFGTLGVGHAVGRRITGAPPQVATAIGVVVTVVALQLVGLVPVVGGLVALAVLLAGLGATILTYFGLAPFEPVRVTD